MVLWEEVDRIIARRLRLPSYATWRRRRLKVLAELRRPEHWGLHADSPLARALRSAEGEHVLLAGVDGRERRHLLRGAGLLRDGARPGDPTPSSA